MCYFRFDFGFNFNFNCRLRERETVGEREREAVVERQRLSMQGKYASLWAIFQRMSLTALAYFTHSRRDACKAVDDVVGVALGAG